MRPQTLDDYVGQESVVGKGSLLRGLLDSGSAGSLILVSQCTQDLRFEVLTQMYLSGDRLDPVGLDL